MNLAIAVVAFLLALMLVFVGVTRITVWRIERRNPPVGTFIDIGGTRIHYVHVPGPANADLPAIVFIHGASANLKDQMLPMRPQLEGLAEMLFFDRPGYGWSSRGSGNETPDAQAHLLAALMTRLGISRAIIVGHSFGGALTAAFAVDYPQKVAGLVFASAATHPWPGGKTSWYYEVAALPVVGWLFTETLTAPAGAARMPAATKCVFAPNATPENYVERASIPLVLRPSSFRANARDVQSLFGFATRNAARYRKIRAPTVIISGDRDTVVFEEIHSAGLARDIPGAELVWVHNMGHKPDWIASDLIVAAIEKLAGWGGDLASAAQKVEARIAADNHSEGCVYPILPEAELSPP